MSAARSAIAAVSLILLATGILFQFFIVLSGSVDHTPLNKTWFLRADTSGLGNAPADAAWTFLALCNYVGGVAQECRHTVAALPFNPPQNFATTNGIPADFLANMNHYYYLSRFMFAFFIISLFFSVVGLFASLLAFCSRLGSYLSGLTVAIALFFQIIAASLMTAWTVQGRNAFRSANRDAHVGAYAYGWAWATVFAFLVCTILFCVGGGIGGSKRDSSTTTRKSSRSSFGRRNRGANGSKRSRGLMATDKPVVVVPNDYE